ncbi:DUF4062 domain-containing protein [Occultella kanbiaonis]|uniref:DUF4062 domain-containing protein n=1 Tax=Occultella kanbiaonis TaxID=2675754 RepID=UPI0012B88208|nr:DUF4062 domain-containing protein [Occultella kanbiaonis]
MPRHIRIFVSSPGDVSDERRQCGEVIEELNTTVQALLPELDTQLEVIRWETDTHPDLTGSPQEVVDDQLPKDYDVFLGIMWSRFGTPTGTAGSGTEHEFLSARRGWETKRRPAHLLFYFCEASIPPKVAGEHADQLKAVFDFRTELSNQGLVGSYEDRSRFSDTVRRDLVLVLARLLHGQTAQIEDAQGGSGVIAPADHAIVRNQVEALTREYEHLRETMQSGDRRTRRMEVVASQLRSLAQSAYPLLPDLATSQRPGDRLAAVCILQAIPDAAYLDWLGERMPAEQPFLGYHAAVALLVAARDLPVESLDQVAHALERAESMWSRLLRSTDRSRVLDNVRGELKRRLSGTGRL